MSSVDFLKAKAESLVLAGNSKELKTCALRPSVILGEDDYQLIPAIHRCIAKGETPFQIGDGDNLYDCELLPPWWLLT